MPYIANPLEGLPIRNSFITDQANLGATPATDDTLIIYDISATALKQLTIANLQASLLVAPAFTGVPTAPTASAGTSTTQLATTAFVTTATTALNTIDEMTDTTIDSVGSGEVLKWSGSAWINNTLAQANILPVAGPTFTGVLTVGSAVLSEADLEQIDDLTAGTAVASKALVVDGNKDIGTLRNLTIDGTFSDGNYTFDTSGNVTGLGTIGSGNITSTGTVQGTTITATTAFVPDASDGAALGTAALEFSDLFLADAAVISLGDDDDVTLTHVVDTGILLSSTDRFQFGDAGTFIHQSADGVLTIESDTTVDINGAVVFDGALTGATAITSTGVITGTTIEATADTSASDNAAIGYTAAEGLILTGQGSTNDITIKNDADATVMSIPTGTTGVTFAGTVGSGAITSTGVVTATGFTIGSAAVTEAQLEILDGATVTTAELNLLDALDRGSILYGNASGVTTVLGQGGADTVLTSDGDDISWEAPAAGTTLSGSTNNTVVTVTGANAMIGEANLTFNGSTLALTGNMTVSTNVDIAGDLTLSAGADGALRFSAASSVKMLDDSAVSLVFEEADNAYMTFVTTNSSEAVKFDKALDINAAIQSDSTITVGVDGTGYDVKFFGATSGAYMLWDENVDDLILAGAAQIIVPVGQLVLGSTAMTSTAAELNVLDGVTLGTAIASKGVTTDGSIDTTGQRNLTITGALTAVSLDISGDVDVDGTLEADAITVASVALGTFIRDTVGTNMLSSNAESGISVTYDTTNDNIDFALDTAQTTLETIYNAALKAGRDTENLIDFATTDDEIILRVAGVNEVKLAADALSPVTNNGAALGTTALKWSDLFLADAAVINFDAGNMTITHSDTVLTVAGGTLATAALTTSTIVASGIVKTNNATEATSTTDGSLQTDGGLSVVKDAIFGDDVTLISDDAVLSFGADSEVTLTHIPDDGLRLNTDMQLQFRDAAINIRSDADGDLDINANDELELNSTLIDINGAVDISGALDLHATLDMNTNDIDNIKSATFITEVANGATSGTMTIDWGAGQKQSVVLSDNTAFTFTAPDGPCNLMLKVTHAANTTTYTPTWAGGSTNVDWPAATAPTFTQTSGSVDIVAFYYDGTNANGTYYGSAQLAFG